VTRLKHRSFSFQVASVLALILLAELFGDGSNYPESHVEWQLANIRKLADEAGESFGYQMPATVNPPSLDFARVRAEFEKLDFNCVEVHSGIDTELVAAGIATFCSTEQPTEVIVARFERRR
jgi:hypothetical protein